MEIRVLASPEAAQAAPGFARIGTKIGEHAVEATFRGLSKVSVTDDGAIKLSQPRQPTHTLPHGDLIHATDPDGLDLAVRTLGMPTEQRPEQTTDWSRRSDGTLDLAFRNVTTAQIDADDQLTLTFTDGDTATVEGLARFKRIATPSHQFQY